MLRERIVFFGRMTSNQSEKQYVKEALRCREGEEFSQMGIKSKGFVTIATGSEKYYQLANNLLKSYRAVAKKPFPFAIIVDRENEYTKDFDDVILFRDKPDCSYMDKLSLSEYIPYDETIFIDADSLCVCDPVNMFEDFQDCDDFSFYGWRLPLDSVNGGWFDPNSCGSYKDKIHCIIGGHGGVYYLRRTENCRQLMFLAKDIASNWHKYKFAHFSKPADEPVFALAMAVTGYLPCEKEKKVLFWPRHRYDFKVNSKGTISCDTGGQFYIVHFGTEYTRFFTYQWLRELIINDFFQNNHEEGKKKYLRLKLRLLPLSIKKNITHFGFICYKKMKQLLNC